MGEPNPSSSFRGQLQEFQLVELVQTVGITNNSGALYLTHTDGRRGVIYFVEGALAWCREYDGQALTLGAILQQLDMVDAHAIESLADRQVQDPLGNLLGQALVERKHLTEEQLGRALSTQILWTVREMALWATGSYDFVVNEMPPPRTATQRIESSKVALEIVRYQYEWNDLNQWLPDGMHTQLRMASEPPADHPLIFSAAVWRVVTRVNAFQTPRRVANALRQPEMEVARIIASLIGEALLLATVSDYSLGLPTVARSINVQSIDIFSLISRMEQDWKRRKSLVEQLGALATFINWTMDELASAWAKQNTPLAPDSLDSLLRRENLMSVAGYQMHVESNHIVVDDLVTYFRGTSGNYRRGAPDNPLHLAYDALCLGLSAVFTAINMRVDSPQDRGYHEAAWTAMFEEFEQTLRD